MTPLLPIARGITAALLLSFAASAFAQGVSKAVSMDEARALVLDLPEVKAWQEDRRKAAEADRKAPATGGILTGSRMPMGKKHWAVTFYTNPATSPEKWATFLVRASDGKLFVESEGGKPIPLEQWRKTNGKPTS
jgi:hypothetical protein